MFAAAVTVGHRSNSSAKIRGAGSVAPGRIDPLQRADARTAEYWRSPVASRLHRERAMAISVMSTPVFWLPLPLESRRRSRSGTASRASGLPPWSLPAAGDGVARICH